MAFCGGFTGIYGPMNSTTYANFWEELSVVHREWSLCWFIGDDFNIVRFPSEK